MWTSWGVGGVLALPTTHKVNARLIGRDKSAGALRKRGCCGLDIEEVSRLGCLRAKWLEGKQQECLKGKCTWWGVEQGLQEITHIRPSLCLWEWQSLWDLPLVWLTVFTPLTVVFWNHEISNTDVPPLANFQFVFFNAAVHMSSREREVTGANWAKPGDANHCCFPSHDSRPWQVIAL